MVLCNQLINLPLLSRGQFNFDLVMYFGLDKHVQHEGLLPRLDLRAHPEQLPVLPEDGEIHNYVPAEVPVRRQNASGDVRPYPGAHVQRPDQLAKRRRGLPSAGNLLILKNIY